MNMDNKDRVALIRAGNELFNNGDIEKATKIFIKTEYRDGITRVADHYFYEKKLPLVALQYYKMVKREDKVSEIYERMYFALGKILGREEPTRPDIPSIKISPKLKILAQEILNSEAGNEKKG